MLKIFTVAFFGHRYIDNPFKVEELIEEQIRKFINEKEYVDFIVGRNGEFDQCVSSTVLRVRKNYRDDNSSLVLMLPYPTVEYINNQNYFEDYYSDIEISYAASKAHPKAAIQIRNREMVDRADLIICYIEHNEGGAYKTVKYASEHNKPIINLADFVDDWKGEEKMKVFKFIVVCILTLITIQTAYYALLYKVQIATGTFFICLGITLFVACDGGLERNKKTK